MPNSLSNGSRRVNGARGFTLIELAVTFALLGILLALGLPSFMSWVRSSQARTVAEALQGGIRRAQTDAVRLNQPVVLAFTNATPAWNAAAVVGGKNWSVQSIQQFDKLSVFLVGGSLADAGSSVIIAGTSNALCFNSNGRLIAPAAPGVPGAVCVAGPQQFDIEPTGRDTAKGDRRLRVLVAIGGQVRMCDPDRPTLSATSPDGCP
jgi:type IV fimbrial biogenesis protein FimT